MMQPGEAVGKGQPAGRAEKFLVLPFRQLRQPRQRAGRRLGHHARKQPFGKAIDRFDRRQGGKARLVENAVRMDHLPVAVEGFDEAGDPARLPERQEFLDPAGIGAEKTSVRSPVSSSVRTR